MVDRTDFEQEFELEDIFDELYELELDDDVLISRKVRQVYKSARPPEMDRRLYLKELLKLQLELIKLQDWVEAPWYVVEANDKRRARLNSIAHLLSLIPYEEVPRETVTLPDRVSNPNYERSALPRELYVPEKY
jgi:polyphosphate kinase 2 (PPK2 family)